MKVLVARGSDDPKTAPRRLTLALAKKLVGKCVPANVLPASGGETGRMEILCVLNVKPTTTEPVQMIAQNIHGGDWFVVDTVVGDSRRSIAGQYDSLRHVKNAVLTQRNRNQVIVFV
jgi:hypothetical protein